MSIINVGPGSYTTTLPFGEVGVLNFQGESVSPLIATTFTEPIPTNDWFTSIVFPYFGDQHSAPLFAQPLNMKADSAGLNLGYTETPTFIYDGTGRQVKFEYTYHADLNVSLDGMNASNTLLEKTSAYFNTALWQDSDSGNQLQATFGHGSPFTYFERTGDADVVINLKASNVNAIGQPNATNEVFQIKNVNGVYNGGQINLDLLVNAVDGQGSHIGNAVQARISIDHNGGGKFDYVNTVNFMPLDGDINNSEHYTQNEERGTGASEIGQLQNLNNATIKVEVWKPFGTGDVAVKSGLSQITLPFDNFNNPLFLSNDGTQNLLTIVQPAASSIILGASPNIEVVSWDGPGEIWYYDHNVLGITVNGNSYGLFAPVESDWHVNNGVITSDLNGKTYFSSALLPDASLETLHYFYDHAYAFVTDSHAAFSYDAENAKVITEFSVTTDLKESGFSSDALTALYPHQWLHSDNALTQLSYETPKGDMKLLEGNSFTTEITYTGILPALPNFLDAAQTQQLSNLIQAEYQHMRALPITIPGEDSYWSGKAMARLGELAQLADQVGNSDAKTFFVNAIKTELQDWFTVDGTEGDKQFYYNSEWNTLQAYPASFNSNTEINDHHFHYGYFVKAAAVVAQFDPQWAVEWDDMVNLIIQDVANSDEMNAMFPYLRNFDPYAGHSWASGDGAFFSGNNHESSSEALNFSSAVTLWGAQTGDVALQNLGNYLFSTEIAAVQQYWFDINNMNFPDGFDHSTIGMVWGDGAVYGTWFSAEPEMIHGINYLPVTAASLYLGLYPEYAAQNYAEMLRVNGAAPNQWPDLMLEYQALFNPAAAVNSFTMNYSPEDGESYSHTYSWIHNLNVLGQVDRTITADTPFFAVFNKEGLITHVAYNPTNAEQVVTFSDGVVMTLASEEMKAMNANRDWSSVTGLVEHTSVPDPVPVPTPTPTPTPIGSDIIGTDQSETLIGTQNSDVIYALAGDDIVHAGAGNDVIDGGAGSDRIYGNVDNNIIIGDAGADFMHGGSGNNIYKYVVLSDSTASHMDTIEQFAHGKDKLDLSALNIHSDDVLIQINNDLAILTVKNSDFTIKLVAMTGAITLSDIIFNPDANATPVPDPTPNPVPDPIPVIPPDSAITGTANAEILSGTMASDILYGLGGDDQLHGLAGDDTVHGGDGNDSLFGREGNDILIGGAGSDFINAEAGNDVYEYHSLMDSTKSAMDFIQNFEQGSDKIDLSALNVAFDQLIFTQENGYNYIGISGTDFEIKIGDGYKIFTSADFILDGDAQATPNPELAPAPVPTPDPTPSNSDIVGTNAAETLLGTEKSDALYALDEDDIVHAGAGDDLIYGGAGNDRLYGNAGNNTLIGGSDADFMAGGAGQNIYQYRALSDSTSAQTDIIEGFKQGRDKVDLSLLNINSNDIHITTVNDSSHLTIDHTDFAIDFIASGPVTSDDIIV